MHTTYSGERVRIRPFAGVEEWLRIICEEEQKPNDHWGYWYWPRKDARKEFEKAGMLVSDAYSAFAVERIDTGELVGYEEYGAMSAGKCGTWIGTFVVEQHRHNGFGIEAKLLNMTYLFENYPLRTIVSDTTQTHLPAQRGLEACGFRHIGARRKSHCFQSKWVDIVQYQILREEWEKLPIREIVKRGT